MIISLLERCIMFKIRILLLFFMMVFIFSLIGNLFLLEALMH